jgi:NADH-quinone oxidoreductase subunit N
MAYLYGMTGVSNLKALAYLIQNVPGQPQVQLGLVALVFIMAGLGFRVAAVPFHFYAPDVYQGSPTILAALLAWVPKGLGFVAILRTLVAVLGAPSLHNPLISKAALLAAILAVVTMTLGNTVALAQTNLKRLFAYSSIAHAGYLMIGIAVAFRRGSAIGIPSGAESLLFYLVAYSLMTLGAFAVILVLNSGDRPVETVDDMAGLAQTHRGLALQMAVCLFSLAGIPPLAGFVGKFQLFTAAWSAGKGDDAWLFQALALIGAINSAIGAYYYLRIVVVMFLRPATGKPFSINLALPTRIALAVCTIGTLVLGPYPVPVMVAAREAAESISELPEEVAAVAPVKVTATTK